MGLTAAPPTEIATLFPVHPPMFTPVPPEPTGSTVVSDRVLAARARVTAPEPLMLMLVALTTKRPPAP